MGRCSIPSSFSRQQRGQALLAVLVLLLVIGGSSATFVWFMNQQQARAGARHRDLAALHLAEAAVHQALETLEVAWASEEAAAGVWPPVLPEIPTAVGPLAGRMRAVVEALPDGTLAVMGEGHVAGATRRLRARVILASPALLAAVYGASVVQFDRPPAALTVTRYGPTPADRGWAHIAAGEALSFVHLPVTINDPALFRPSLPGPADVPGVSGGDLDASPPGPLRVLLGPNAGLTVGESGQQLDPHQLRLAGVVVDERLDRLERLPVLPEVDRAYYRSLAQANTGNAGINQAAGHLTGDADLERKADALYSARQFEHILTYLGVAEVAVPLRGVIYVAGPVTIPARQRLAVVDGALIAESTVQVGRGATLTVTHSAATRALPGILTMGHGALVVGPEAQLFAHGLIYASRVIDTGVGARIEVVGALASADPQISVRTNAATMVVRYDPAVLGTPGLRTPRGHPVIAWVAAWEELPGR